MSITDIPTLFHSLVTFKCCHFFLSFTCFAPFLNSPASCCSISVHKQGIVSSMPKTGCMKKHKTHTTAYNMGGQTPPPPPPPTHTQVSDSLRQQFNQNNVKTGYALFRYSRFVQCSPALSSRWSSLSYLSSSFMIFLCTIPFTCEANDTIAHKYACRQATVYT